MDQGTLQDRDRWELTRLLESQEANWGALEEARLIPGVNCRSVAEGIRELIKQRDALLHELKRIKGIADGALGK